MAYIYGLDAPESEETYKKRQQAVSRIMKEKLAKAGDVGVIKDLKREKDTEESAKKTAMCRLTRAVFDECLQNYEKGEFTYKKFISELKDSLEALS